MPKLQLSLVDLFWVTGLIASIVGAVSTDNAEIAWIGTACVLLFVWHRPVLLRLWTVAMVGIGTGLFCAGLAGNRVLMMNSGALLAYGAGMVVGSVTAFFLFDVRKPA